MTQLSGNAGLYHFKGQLIEVPESGEVTVSDDLVEVMLAAGFTVKDKPKAKK